MATLKRAKSQRGDQPTLFGGAEPVVISGEPVVFKAKNESRAGVVGPVAKGDAARKGRSELLGIDNKIPSKSDRDLDGRTVDRTVGRTDGDLDGNGGRLDGRSSGAAGVAGADGPKDSAPPSPIDSPRFYQSEQRDSHRPFAHVHRKRTADEVIRFEPDTPGYTPPAWRAYGRVAYVTKTLLVVVADCDAADDPDRILVRLADHLREARKASSVHLKATEAKCIDVVADAPGVILAGRGAVRGKMSNSAAEHQRAVERETG